MVVWGISGANCRGAACRSRRYAADPNRLSLKWKWPQICHCEGALRPWQSREGTGDSHRPPLKWYAPIASVAALSERHGQLQIWRHSRRMCNASKFVIARPQRGRGNLGKAVAISPMTSLLSGRVLRDCHVASLLAMTNLGALCGRQSRSITCQPARRSLSAATVKFDSDCVRRHSVYIGSAFPRLPRRFAPRNDKSDSLAP